MNNNINGMLEGISQKDVLSIFTRFRKENPHPTTLLNFSSPFELLLAVILSARSTDISVNRVTAKLYSVANNPETVLSLGVDGIKRYIKTIGLFNRKAENIIKTCRMLIELHSSKVPDNQIALASLPGVGRKSANIILNTVFGRPTVAVDTHVFRVCNRTGIAPGRNVKQVEEKILKIVPAEFKISCHNWLVLHGRYTCVSRKPHCTSCVIEDLCKFRKKISI